MELRKWGRIRMLGKLLQVRWLIGRAGTVVLLFLIVGCGGPDRLNACCNR